MAESAALTEPIDTRLRTQLIVISSTLTGLGTLVVGLRMLSRARVLHSTGKDDWVMLIAWAFTIVYLALVAVGTTYGQGLHVKDWKPEWFDPGFKSILAIQAVYYFCVYFVKVSILFFYLRLSSAPMFKKIVWGTFGLLTAFLCASIMTVFLQCMPLSQFWDLTLLPTEKNCINTTAFFYSTSVFNIITDVWILLLPVKLLWRVQRPTIQKIALLGVFAVGSFACIASCIRLYTIEIFTKSADPLYDSVPVNIWSFIEINVAIFTASVPALKALWHKPASRTETVNPSAPPSLESPLASLLSQNSQQLTENAYLHTIALLDDLRSKPSCHRQSIGNLLAACYELQRAPDPTFADNRKARLASRIAICEFESTGIDYPSECKTLKGEDGNFAREETCIKRLGDRAQWWTTLSNSMQTVNVVCKSVGREVERDELLELHTSITAAQRELYLAVRRVLAEIFTATEYQESFSKDMSKAFAMILKDMDKLRIRMRQAYKENEDEISDAMNDIRNGAEATRKETSSTFRWLRQEIQNAHQFMAIWDVSFRRFWSDIETTGEKAQASTQNLVDTVESLTGNIKDSSSDVARVFRDVMSLAESLNEQALATKAILDSQAEQSRELLQDLEMKLAETQQSLSTMQSSLSFSTMTLEWTVQYLYWFLNQMLVRVVICTVLSLLAGMISKGGSRQVLEVGGILMCSSLLVSLPQSLVFDSSTTQYTIISGAIGAVIVGAFYVREHLRVQQLEKELERDREYRENVRLFRESRHRRHTGEKWSFNRRTTRSLLGNSGTW
ncbi:hypothetical protein BJ508DRAFT_359027 [Ascobolus immersus RN42]|uniref:Rhodopsin domain-containing protein n=1 Tax=Ascobolus immersus RN42 TaxID=1160509 RepID=A0A3N4IGM1_ASCIM|nr:hypothetical protein BJ508DRAFT_359027 [Ascobolus immersus RN42]